MLRNIVPRSIEISPHQCAACVSQQHSIRVHHGHNFENQFLPHLFGDPVVTRQKLHHSCDQSKLNFCVSFCWILWILGTLNYERRCGVGWVRPSQDNDEVFAIHISFHLVSDCNQRDWQPMLGRDTFFRFYRKPSKQDIGHCLSRDC